MAAFNCHLLKKLLIMLIATNIKQKKTAKQIFETVFYVKYRLVLPTAICN